MDKNTTAVSSDVAKVQNSWCPTVFNLLNVEDFSALMWDFWDLAEPDLHCSLNYFPAWRMKT